MILADRPFQSKILIVNNGRRASERVRLLLLHPRILFRASLARLLATERGFCLTADCASVAEAMDRMQEPHPDVILFDFGLWQTLVPKAQEAGFTGRLLGIAEEFEAVPCVRALSRGVAGVVLGSDPPARLVQAIQVVASGAAWVDHDLIRFLAERYPHHEDIGMDSLNQREQAVLRGILNGLTNRRIADQIGASESTVKATLQNLFEKTGVRTRSQLVRFMLAGQIVRSDNAHGLVQSFD